MESLGLLAPYHNQMVLGQGFNSFSQEICLVEAVDIVNEERPFRGRSASPGLLNGSTLSPSIFKDDGGRRRSEPASRGRSHSVAASILSMGSEEGKDQTLGPRKAHDRQKVVFETKMVSSQADVDHSLGVSSYASLTAGNQGGKAAAFVDTEGESHDGDLHYHVKVVVTNESHIQQQEMAFHEYPQFTNKLIETSRAKDKGRNAAASEFTRVYGDRFISGFVEGGSLSAIISIKLHDKKDSKKIRTEASAKLAMGQTPLSGEVGGSTNTSNSSSFSDHEVLVNVRWTGGGHTPVEEKNWDLDKLIAVANAFPTMVSHASNKLFAVLTPYSALGTFLDWQMKHSLENCVLDYTKCEEYMSILLSDFNALESVQIDINRIMANRSYYRTRKPHPPYTSTIEDSSPKTRRQKALSVGSIPTVSQTAPTPSTPTAATNRLSTLTTEPPYTPRRSSESELVLSHVDHWIQDEAKYNLSPIQPNLPGLDKARWLCCQARMSIKEEAEALVLHPDKAVQISEGSRLMRTPDYLRPLVLKECLPEYHGVLQPGEADPIVPNYVLRDGMYFCAPVVGDEPTRHREYTHVYSDEPGMLEAPHEIGVRLGGYAPSWWQGRFAKECRGALGRVGISFSAPHGKGPRGLRRRSSADRKAERQAGLQTGVAGDVSRVVVWHRVGSGYIQGLELFDKHGGCVAGWKQWGNAGRVPEGVVERKLRAPDDGYVWRFVGLGTEWDTFGGAWLGGRVLSRVAAVWKRV